jgi:outer membrane receptor protein involved in Fe transport
LQEKRRAAAIAMAFSWALPAAAQSAPDIDAEAAIEPSVLHAVTVTASREQTLLMQSPASVGVIDEEDIRATGPMHPQQIIGQVPGAAVAVTNGEGHTTAIRQPFTTNPVYLYLEDGIPIRATGFFNHNALYETNLPQAGGIEIVKGPGSALYGSDAIGGIVNILSRTPSATPATSLSGEIGSFGWQRLLLDGTTGVKDGAMRVSANLTHTDGWRDKTAYDRQSVNLRHDRDLGEGALLKTILGYTHIDQQTGANSALTYRDYIDNPTKNNFGIAWRKVEALRLSTQYEREKGGSLLTITPYVRSNAMDLNGSYNLSFDPRDEKTNVFSLGVMTKWRRDFDGALKPRLIAGLDMERSPGKRTEDSLNVSTTGSGADKNYYAYTFGNRIYDYDVVFRSASPYVQGELSPAQALRVTAGLRFDSIGYDMSNHVAAATTQAGTRYYGQIASASVDYASWSPKLGATLALSPSSSLYTSYNFGFRAPTESQLFRAGSDSAANAATKAQLALGLQPVKARQFEVGWRGGVGGWSYDLAAYRLVKSDDLVSQKDLATNISTTVNAAKTEHTGIELALGKTISRTWRIDTALSYAIHRYSDWSGKNSSNQFFDYSGNEMAAAPRFIGNTRLTWKPRRGTSAQLEWVSLGEYWLEDSNSATYGKYAGHDVFNLRFSQDVSKDVRTFVRLMNLTDRRYADSASVSSATPVFTPALPRALYLGLEAMW